MKSLASYSIRAQDGTAFRPLLALVFMFMDKTEKQQLLIDAGGLSVLLKVIPFLFVINDN